MIKRKNKYNISLYEEKNNTSLVGIIGVFIMLVSIIGNGHNANSRLFKSNLLESNKNITITNNKNVLVIGRQNVIINGQEFIIDITPKY